MESKFKRAKSSQALHFTLEDAAHTRRAAQSINRHFNLLHRAHV